MKENNQMCVLFFFIIIFYKRICFSFNFLFDYYYYFECLLKQHLYVRIFMINNDFKIIIMICKLNNGFVCE